MAPHTAICAPTMRANKVNHSRLRRQGSSRSLTGILSSVFGSLLRPTEIAFLDAAFNVISPKVSAPKTSDTDQALPVASDRSLTTAMASSESKPSDASFVCGSTSREQCLCNTSRTSVEQSDSTEVGTNEATSPNVLARGASITDRQAPVTALSSRTQAMASSESSPSVCRGVAAVNEDTVVCLATMRATAFSGSTTTVEGASFVEDTPRNRPRTGSLVTASATAFSSKRATQMFPDLLRAPSNARPERPPRPKLRRGRSACLDHDASLMTPCRSARGPSLSRKCAAAGLSE